MKLITKNVTYTNKDNQDFILEEYTSIGPNKKNLRFHICNNNDTFYFLTSEEVDEFIELLKKKQKEIWS